LKLLGLPIRGEGREFEFLNFLEKRRKAKGKKEQKVQKQEEKERERFASALCFFEGEKGKNGESALFLSSPLFLAAPSFFFFWPSPLSFWWCFWLRAPQQRGLPNRQCAR
jgi:hypothetical protein